MKYPVILLSFFLVVSRTNESFSQQHHLEVQGNVMIRGNININHPDDTTTVYIGRRAGVNTNSDFRVQNTFVGADAGYRNTNGNENSFFGWSAGRENTTGSNNSFFGKNSGTDNLGGGSNSFFGKSAGSNNTSGSFNNFFGRGAGGKNKRGTRNTFVGAFANQLTFDDSLDRAIAIGYNAEVDCSHCAIIGGIGEDAVKVGIGTNKPERTLDVRGELFVMESAGIAFFQSSSNNSFISLENNGGTGGGTDLGYFNDNSDKYAYIDLPGGDFGEMTLDQNGNMTILGTYSPSSDRNRKENFKIVNPLDLLKDLYNIPISEWQFKGESIRHIGPMAQDFYAAFGLGQGETTISTVDADGIAFAAIQALYERDIEKDLKIENQQSEINALKERIYKLEKLLLTKAALPNSDE